MKYPYEEIIRRSDSCAVSDALDRLGLPGVVSGIRRFTTCKKLVGPVATVTLASDTESKTGGRHLGTACLEHARAGDVVLVSNAGRTAAAGWGGLLGLAARKAGISGAIIDGAFRDVDELEALDFPMFARDVVPTSARGRYIEIAEDHATLIQGVKVSPGDWVVADGSGVVFISSCHMHLVAKTVSEILQTEQEFRDAIEDGESAATVLDSRYERLTRPLDD